MDIQSADETCLFKGLGRRRGVTSSLLICPSVAFPALSISSSARCTDIEKQNEEGGRGEEIRFAAGGKGLGLCEKGLRQILQRLRGGFWRGGREMGRLPGRRWRVPRRQRASQITRLRGQR